METAMLNRFKLATKFTLLLSLVFIGAIALSGLALSHTLGQKAEAEISYRSQILANEILGTQVIYVPASKVFDDAHRASFSFISIFTGIFALVILLINYLLKRSVLQPLKPMAQLAQKISIDKFY